MNDKLMREVGMGKFVDLKTQGKCPFCKKSININEFNDELSLREFYISGICQKCQDETFGK